MVRLEIFQRIGKKIHAWFSLTEKAAGSLRRDSFANKLLQSTNSRPACCTPSQKRQPYSSVARGVQDYILVQN